MLDDALRAQLREHLTKVVHRVELVATVSGGDRSDGRGDSEAQMLALLDEVAALSDMLSVRHDGTAARTPSIRIERAGTPVGVEFAGVPLGHELSSFVLALLHVGGHRPKVIDELADAVRALDGELRFETYLSLSCQNCPDVVQALNIMSVLNENIHHVAIDGALFQDEVAERGVLAVPSVYLNGELFAQGRMTLEAIVAKLDAGAGARKAADLDAKAPFDLLIVGGGPAAAAAAVYSARKGVSTGVVAERFGGQVLDTMGIDNLIGTPHTEGPALAAALESHVRAHDVDVMDLQRAVALEPAGADGLVSVELATGARLRARTVVLSTGARWRTLDIPGEDEYRNKGVTFCPHCDGPLFAGKDVAVIGGGNSGVEAAIDLAGVVRHVTLIEYGSALRADDVLQRSLATLANVTVLTDTRTTEVIGNGQRVVAIAVEDRETGEHRRVPVDGVFVQIGLLPNTDWLRDVVALNDRGEIDIDAHGRTSVSGVFAAGDCTNVPYKQIVVALGAGSTAALSAFDHLIRLRGDDHVHDTRLIETNV